MFRAARVLPLVAAGVVVAALARWPASAPVPAVSGSPPAPAGSRGARPLASAPAAAASSVTVGACVGGAAALVRTARATPAATASPSAARPPALPPSGSGSFMNAQGSIEYVYYVPTTYRPGTPMPLLLALHGCLEAPATFEAGSRWFEDAEANGYLVVMPHHLVEPDNPYGCYRFWDQHTRGAGEASVLAELVEDFGQSWSVDADRVSVVGMSSGAAMAVVLAATYPDVFAAAGVHSGCEFAEAPGDDGILADLALAAPWLATPPFVSGTAARLAAPGSTRAVPLILVHGDVDSVVAVEHELMTAESFALRNDCALGGGLPLGQFTTAVESVQSGTSPGGRSWTRFTAASGRLEWWVVQGLDHAWSGGVRDAASDAPNGRNFNDPLGPDATAILRTFLLAQRR